MVRSSPELVVLSLVLVFGSFIAADMGHVKNIIHFCFGVGLINKSGVYMSQVRNCFHFSHPKGISFKIEFLLGQPSNKLVWFNSVFHVAECVISIDLASEMDLFFLILPTFLRHDTQKYSGEFYVLPT